MVHEFPVSSRDVTNQTPPGQEYFSYDVIIPAQGEFGSDIPAGDGKLSNLFFTVQANFWRRGEQQKCSYGAPFFRTTKRIANVNPSKLWQQKAYVKDLALAKDIMGNAMKAAQMSSYILVIW